MHLKSAMIYLSETKHPEDLLTHRQVLAVDLMPTGTDR